MSFARCVMRAYCPLIKIILHYTKYNRLPFLNTHIPVPYNTLDTIIRNAHANGEDRHEDREQDRALVVDEGKTLRIAVFQVGNEHLSAQADE